MIGLRDYTLIYLGIFLGSLLGVPLAVLYGPVVALALVCGAAVVGLLRIRSKVKRGQR